MHLPKLPLRKPQQPANVATEQVEEDGLATALRTLYQSQLVGGTANERARAIVMQVRNATLACLQSQAHLFGAPGRERRESLLLLASGLHAALPERDQIAQELVAALVLTVASGQSMTAITRAIDEALHTTPRPGKKSTAQGVSENGRVHFLAGSRAIAQAATQVSTLRRGRRD